MAEMTIKGYKSAPKEEPESRFKTFLKNFSFFDQPDRPGVLSGLGTALMAGGAGFAGNPGQAAQILEAQRARFQPDIEQELKLAEFYRKQREDAGQEELRKSQLDINKAVLQNINKGSDVVYRDLVTGEEVPPEIALENIKSGQGRYAINQRRTTKSGVSETPIVPTDLMNQGEREYVTAAGVARKSLENIQEGFSRLAQLPGSSDWKSFQAMNLPAWAIKNKDVQMFQSDLDSLKGQIPFLRGGKALTANESKRIDVLLNPFGKDKDRYAKDVEKFQSEFLAGEGLAKYGFTPMGTRGSASSGSGKTKSGIGYKIISE